MDSKLSKTLLKRLRNFKDKSSKMLDESSAIRAGIQNAMMISDLPDEERDSLKEVLEFFEDIKVELTSITEESENTVRIFKSVDKVKLLRIATGETVRIRPLNLPILYYFHMDVNNFICMQDDDEIIHYLTNNGIKLRSRVAFYAWKSDDKEVVLATLPKSIVGDILNVCNGSAPNLPSGGHVLSISKVGYGITTKYAVTAEPLLMREQEINMLLEDLPSMTEVLNLKDLDEVKQLLP